MPYEKVPSTWEPSVLPHAHPPPWKTVTTVDRVPWGRFLVNLIWNQVHGWCKWLQVASRVFSIGACEWEEGLLFWVHKAVKPPTSALHPPREFPCLKDSDISQRDVARSQHRGEAGMDP